MLSNRKSKHVKPAGRLIREQNRRFKLLAALSFSAAFFVLLALGAGARNALLQESAVKAASDRFERQMHGNSTPAVSQTPATKDTASTPPKGKQSKISIMPAPRGIDEGNKFIAQTSGSAGGGAVYDPERRIVKIVETRAGVVTSTKQFVWAGNQLCEERDGTGAVTKRFFSLGEQIGGSNYYYTRDQNGSVREMTNSSGVVQSQYGYGPWGEVTKLAGTGPDSDMQYAGMYMHQPSGLNLAVNRAYSAAQGRFISRDPIEDPTFSMVPGSPEPADPGAMTMAGTGQAVSPNMMTIRNVSSNPVVQAQVALAMMGSHGPTGSHNVNSYAYANNNPISLTDRNGTSVSLPNPGDIFCKLFPGLCGPKKCPKDPTPPDDPEGEWNYCAKLCAQYTGKAWEECMYWCLGGKK